MNNRIALIKKTISVLFIWGIAQGLFAQNVDVNSIVITFESTPNYTVSKAPLKFNKDFALSYHLEDGTKDIFTHAFQYLNGGVIESTVYPGIFFTDGCGNDIPFKMGTSIFSHDNSQTIDLLDPDGANTSTYATWPEIIELYNAGWGIYNQGFTSSNSGDINYLVKRNHSYIKYKTQSATNNGIETKIFVNPQDDISFSSPAFNHGYNAAFRSYVYGTPELDVTNTDDIIDIDSLKMGRTNLISGVSLGRLADTLNAHSNTSTKMWSSAYNKSLTGGASGYDFNVFKFYIDYIEDNYGKNGADNIWMTSEEEVLDYLALNKIIDINTELLGNQLLITFSGTIPTDIRFYALSLIVGSDVKITNIEINGGANHSYTPGVDSTEALINLNWDGKVVVSKSVNAETYVSLAEATEDQNDVLVAMDYVNMLESGQTMLDFRERLCAIPGAILPDGWCDCSFTLGNDTVICLGDTISLEAPPGAVSYSWNTGDTSQSIIVNPLESTSYSVTVYNDQGCFSTDTKFVIVKEPSFANALAIEDTICVNTCTSIIATGGSEYLWSNGGNTPLIEVCPTQTTDYIVTITDNFGCIDTDTVTVTTLPQPDIQISNDTSICKTECVTLMASGGYQYLWSNGATTNEIEVCPDVTTTYYVTVTNDKDCSAIDSVTVTVIDLPSISLNSDTNICLGDCVELTAIGGDIYLWSTGATTETIEVCPDDTTMYTVNVFSEAGCLSKDTVTLNVLPIPTSIVSNDTTVCPETCVRIFASGGENYLWSTGETNDTIEVCPSEPTIYYVTVFNEFGCGVLDSVQINHLPLTNANAGADQTICPGDEATLLATGGYSYIWNTGQETNTIKVSPEVSTEYIVTVTTANACPANDTVIVSVLTPPVANAGIDQTICPDECVSLEASGGVNYLWSNGTETQSNTVCPTESSIYFVTVYDDFGCSANDTVEIFIAETPSISFSGLSSVYCDNDAGVLLEGNPTGGIFEGQGISNNIFYPAIAGTGTHEITYRIENENGCFSKSVNTTNVYTSPIISLGNDTTICTDATLTLSAPSGLDSYLWSSGETNNTIIFDGFGLGGTSTLVQLIATLNGCVAIDEINVSVISCTVGIDDLSKEGIYMYPNPTTGQFNIRFNTQEKDMRVDIINLQGQIIFSEELNDCNQPECVKSINLSTYNKGIYIVRFSNNNLVKTAKLLLN